MTGMYSVLAPVIVLLEEGLGAKERKECQAETAVSLSTAMGFTMLFLNPKLCPLFCGLELSGSNANVNFFLGFGKK